MAQGNDSGQPGYAPDAGGDGALPPGTLLNGIYRIENRLGAGGMGEVYRATNIANDDQDAIKIIGRGMANQTIVEAMFRKEARVLRRIQSPAVAQLRLFARDPALDVLYFVTEFVAGVSLLDRLRQRPAGPDELRALMARMCIGLQAVHDAGAIHRDLSPDNIILPDGDVTQAKIIDFGIVKELDPSQVSMIGDGFAGKFGYIAPEQLGFTGSRIGPWTDLYALALVGLAFAAGKPLYMGATMGTADEARRKPIDLDVLPPELRPVFARMLTYDWRERVSSASAVLAMLDVSDGETMVLPSAPPPPPAAPPPPPPAPPAPVQWGRPASPLVAPPPAEAQHFSQPPYGAQPHYAQPLHGAQPHPSQPPYGAQLYPPAGYPPQQFATVPPEHPIPPGAVGGRKLRWPIFAGIAALLMLVAAATWWWMAPPPFAVPGVPMRDTATGLQYQILAPGSGGAKPSPGDTVLMRVRQRIPGEAAPGPGAVVVEQLRPERMWVGQIEAIRLMTKGQRLLVWVPPPLRGPTEAGVDTTPPGKRAVLDIELIDFGRADSPLLRARIQELGQQLPDAQPTPVPAPTPTPTAVPTIETIVVPTIAPTPAPAPLPTVEPTPMPVPTTRPTAAPRRPVRVVPVERETPRQQPQQSAPGEDSARKGE